MARTVSPAGVKLVADFEGFRGHPYRDAVGVWTIGYGETRGVGPNSPWISEASARRQLERRLNADFASRIPNAARLNQHQFDALASFVYNVGPGALAPSTGIGRALRAGNFRQVASELLRWDKAGGRSLLGLTRRRQAERKLFLLPVAKAHPKAVLAKLKASTGVTTLDGVPVFRGLKRVLLDARAHGWAGTLTSADRRKGIPERYGKLSQAALYAGWIAHKLGFNPANPPGRSTHELRSDGVAYRGPVGRPLSWWQEGLDASLADQLRSVLARLGYDAFQPYKTGSEVHHTNFHISPVHHWRQRRRQKRL